MSMSDEEFSKILKDSLSLKKRPPVTKKDVEEFLSTPDSDMETVERVRARFVEKAFLSIHRKPVKQIMDLRMPSFSKWIAEARQKAHLTRKEIDRVLGQNTAFVERLESGTPPPWKFDADAVAGLVQLYRVHFAVVEYLIRNTEGSTLPPTPPPTSRAEHRAEGRALLVEFGDRPEFKPEVARWLGELRAALERRQAAHLL
jgi:transcriptional regulator with XRE-family HTH domain